MTLRLIEQLQSHAAERPASMAVYAAGQSPANAWTYSQLFARTIAVRNNLAAHVMADATVMLCYPNRPQYVAGFLGILAGEKTVLTVSSESPAREIASVAQRSGAAAAIVPASAADRLKDCFHNRRALSELHPDAILLTEPTWRAAARPGPALLLQSSGTTSQPKIVRRDGPALDAVAGAMVRACGFSPGDRVLAAVPLCHSYGMEHGLLAPIAAGSCVCVCEKFDLPAVLGELRHGGITLLPGVPFMFDMLGRTGQGPFSSLRCAYSAGGALPRSTFDLFEKEFQLRLGQVYGATEIGSVTYSDSAAPGFDPTSVGLAMENVRIAIVDADDPRLDNPLAAGVEGQVAVSAPSMLSGYLDDPPPALLGGHYLTGDLGVMDQAGRLTITGRLTLLIDVGGRKVNPVEVEAVLKSHPAVGACIVAPMRLSDTVCRLRAVVTPARPGAELSVAELRRFARERLSAYKVPRLIEIRPALPTSASGKVLRRLVETS